jgi:hypothetical protein
MNGGSSGLRWTMSVTLLRVTLPQPSPWQVPVSWPAVPSVVSGPLPLLPLSPLPLPLPLVSALVSAVPAPLPLPVQMREAPALVLAPLASGGVDPVSLTP